MKRVDPPMAVLFGVAGLYVAFFLYHAIRLVLFPYDMDNSEGFLLYQSLRIAQGQFLYSSINELPFLVDNYPPVYPVLGAMTTFLFGESLMGLRLISLGATLGTALLIGVWVQHLTGNRQASLLAGLIYLAFYHVYQWGALARVDSLGGLFALAAMVWLVRRNDWLGSAILVVLALFTKQSLFAAPAAIGLWLLFRKDYRALTRFVAFVFGAGFVLLVLIDLLTEGRAFRHLVLYNANAFFLWDVWLNVRHWLLYYTVWGSLPLVMVLTLGSRRTTPEALLGWFSLFAIAEALLVGKIGSAPNYFLSLCIASSVAAGYVVNLLQRSPVGESGRVLYCSLLCGLFLFQYAATVHFPHSPMQFAETPTAPRTNEGLFLERELSRIEGPVFAELPTVAIRAGHPPLFQPFIFTQLSQEGRWNQSLFLALINQKHFERIVLQFDLTQPDWDRRRFTTAMVEAMRTWYEPDKSVAGQFVYRPTENTDS